MQPITLGPFVKDDKWAVILAKGGSDGTPQIGSTLHCSEGFRKSFPIHAKAFLPVIPCGGLWGPPPMEYGMLDE